MSKQQIAETLVEMANAWNQIEAAAKAQFPQATPDEIYQITSSAMNRAVGPSV